MSPKKEMCLAIENDHMNLEFSHEEHGDFQQSCKRLPEGNYIYTYIPYLGMGKVYGKMILITIYVYILSEYGKNMVKLCSPEIIPEMWQHPQS